MPMGDLPTALVADDKVICVGASDCTFLKDPAMYFDERGDRDIDWDKTGVQAYANSEGWPNYPDDTLHVHGIHSSIAHQYITEELDWPGHRLSKYEEPFGTFGYKPHQNGEVFSPRTSSFFPGDYENQSYYNSVAHEAWLNMGGPLNHLKPSMKVTSYNRAIRTLRSADRMAVDQKATFSNTGPRVDIWAPGVNILSSIPYNFMQPDCIEHMYDMSKRDYPKSRYTTPGLLSGGASLKLDTYLTQSNIGAFIMKETSTAQGRSGRIYSKYGQRSGTSMAGPQVVGLLALYAQKKRDLTQAEAKDWLQTHAYRNYIPDTTNCTPYTTQSSLHESVYGDPVMHDTKRVFGTELLDRIPLKKAMQRINPSVYAHLDTDPSSDQVWYEEVEDMEYFRSRLLDQHEYANPRALMGAPNLIAHFPYYNTPIDDVIIPATRSNNMLSNVSLGGSVGVTNIERSYDTVVFDPAAVRAMPLKDSPLVPETSSRV
jgi:subtilisin family serine protease